MEESRPRSSLSLASSASTISSLSSLSTKKSTRVVSKVHAFGKRGNALRRDPNLPVHIRGWLHKQDSAGLRLWKRRWFVLSGHCLFYYKDSREESVLGSVLLPSYSVRPDGPGPPRGRRFTFTAEHPGMRTYVLAADTLEDMRGWLRALGRASRAEGDDCGPPRSPTRLQRGEGPAGPGGPPAVRKGDKRHSSESPDLTHSRERSRSGLAPPSPTADLRSGSPIRRTRSPDLFTPLSRPPSPLSPPRPSSAPARRPPPTSGDTGPPGRPHTPLSRIDVRPPLDWGPQRQTLTRPPTPRRGPSSEAAGRRSPSSPQPRSQEARKLPGPPLDSTFQQSLETDTLLTKLCGQDRLLRRLQEEMEQRQEEKEQLEAALELTRQQLGQSPREAPGPSRVWGRQRLLQDRLVSVRATLCHLAQERERVWDTYSGLEQELGALRETLEYLLHLGAPQDRASAQQQLWMVEDTLAGLRGAQKPAPHEEPDTPPSALAREETSEREVLSESLGRSSPHPNGVHRDLSSPPSSGAGVQGVSRPPSPHAGAKHPLARPRMSAQEQLERLRKNQESGRTLSRPTSPAVLTLGRTRSPAPRQPNGEQKPVPGHSGTQKWLRSSGSWSSPRNCTSYLPTSEGHRERVLSLSQALATEASQWHRMMTGGNVDPQEDPLPPAPPPPPSDPAAPGTTSPPRSPAANESNSSFSRRGSGRGLGSGPASWETTWDAGTAQRARAQAEGAWPLRVTLLQSSF